LRLATELQSPLRTVIRYGSVRATRSRSKDVDDALDTEAHLHLDLRALRARFDHCQRADCAAVGPRVSPEVHREVLDRWAARPHVPSHPAVERANQCEKRRLLPDDVLPRGSARQGRLSQVRRR